MQIGSVGLALGVSAVLAAAGVGLSVRGSAPNGVRDSVQNSIQAAASNATEQQMDKPKVVLVELFTSEGCSSCPPADALLRQVNGTRTGAGQFIVGISEHVTYWNSLGWADPFSSSIYTDRQNAYSQRFGLDSVYTPQMVVNGAEQFVGSDHAGLTRAIQRQLQQPESLALHIMSITRTGSNLSVSFSASGAVPSRGAEIIAVLADDVDRSSVLRGENSGRTLAHVAVARSLIRVADLTPANAQKEQTVEIPVLPAFQQSLQGPQGHHLILFAQTTGHDRVLGADTKPL